ncbi:hypothetical protein MP228_006369 [Amoeboaphelidium protococcarum]|nr:hypothetical protein MP228_006369 [Amoeboaphelidium protococcarum]
MLEEMSWLLYKVSASISESNNVIPRLIGMHFQVRIGVLLRNSLGCTYGSFFLRRSVNKEFWKNCRLQVVVSSWDGFYLEIQQVYTDLYSALVPGHTKLKEDASGQQIAPQPAQSSSSTSQAREPALAPGIEIQGTQADEPEDLVTFELPPGKRRLRSYTSSNSQKRQRKSLQQMYRQEDDCPGDPTDQEFTEGQQELVIPLGDDQLWEEDDQNEISGEFEDLLDEVPDNEEEIDDAAEQEQGRDYRWLNNPAFPQIDISDSDVTFVGVDLGVAFMATSCIIKASSGNEALQVLQSTEKNAIPFVMLNSEEF